MTTDTAEDIIQMNDSRDDKKSSNITKILVVVLLILCVTGLYFYNQSKTLSQDPNKVNQEKIMAIVERVGKIIDLPTGELPTVAEIADTKPLEGQPFFVNAKKGDQILLYTTARKAFLYDPVANIIIEVASLNIGK